MSTGSNEQLLQHFQDGKRCLVILSGERFLVTILRVDEDRIQVTFPTSDFPIEGMHVDLEFHDDQGYTAYESEVLETPKEVGDGLVVRRPPSDTIRNNHRSAWRVPADFQVTMKHHVHPRRVEVPVINISAGGMLLKTGMRVEVGDSIDLRFTLPGELEEDTLLARVMHVFSPPGSEDSENLVGLLFVNPEQASRKALSNYIWRRLRELDPNKLRHHRRATDRIA